MDILSKFLFTCGWVYGMIRLGIQEDPRCGGGERKEIAMRNMYSVIWTLIGSVWLLVVAWVVLVVVANWKLFSKAGQPGWASIVPFYHDYIVYKIFWGKGWLFVVPILLGLIPFWKGLFSLVAVVIYALTCYKKALAFGKGAGFAVGLFFLNPIFTMILAFGDYTYRGVPQDGTSYDQMKGKYEDFSKKEQARNANVHYTAPDQNKGPENVTYRSPEETDEK